MNYLYKATDETGKTVLGEIEAANEIEVQQRLLHLGYRPQSIAASQQAPLAPNFATLTAPQPPVNTQALPNAQTLANQQSLAANAATRTPSIIFAGNAARLATRNQTRTTPSAIPPVRPTNASELGGVSTHDLMFFFQQLASLVRSGMTVYSALDNLAARTPNANLALTAREMTQQAHRGGRISEVMERYPRIYPEHVVGMVRAGELGGFLEIALAEIADGYDRNIALYRGSWLPKFMASQALLTLALAEPMFPTIFPNADFKGYLLLALRNLLIAALVYAGIKFGGRRLQLPQFRYLRDKWSLRVPPFGDLQRQTALGTFTRTLSRLYKAGVNPTAAWEGAMSTATNVVIRDRLNGAHLRMQQGASLADAFTATGLFSNQVEQLIVTGNHSGEVAESLDMIASFYDDQVKEATTKSRFTMLRLGILAMLILGGGAMLWAVHSYFQGVLHYTDDWGP